MPLVPLVPLVPSAIEQLKGDAVCPLQSLALETGDDGGHSPVAEVAVVEGQEYISRANIPLGTVSSTVNSSAEVASGERDQVATPILGVGPPVRPGPPRSRVGPGSRHVPWLCPRCRPADPICHVFDSVV
ncbi:hypothetical protein DPEC_G00231660 [Dallia pectoralis]|uniref:Uncharacterized protein n=1 Tax=Dallia pectoralis TaxID=75939 RepID=A0ACC2FXF5_DALPE|nr:hypothetical protein DPEC_G00231660 [Dallia pectoralis]